MALEPSESASQTSASPERSEIKATRRPSGENSGIHSLLVEEIETAGGEEALAPAGEVSTRQIFQSAKLRTYTRRGDRPGWGRETTGMIPSSPMKGRRAGVLSRFSPETTSLHRPPLEE